MPAEPAAAHPISATAAKSTSATRPAVAGLRLWGRWLEVFAAAVLLGSCAGSFGRLHRFLLIRGGKDYRELFATVTTNQIGLPHRIA